MRLTKESGCGNYDSEPRCGRPLGMRMLSSGQLIVADAYLGLFIVDHEKGTFENLVRGGATVDGRPLRFLNDVELLNDDVIVFTDSSSKWDRRRFLHIALEGIPNGRLLSFTRSTKQLTVLMDDLYFANGVQLHSDGQSLLIAETTMARITRYYFSGPKKGEREIFSENLPGLPDNIRSSSRDTFWIGMAGIRHRGKFSFLDFVADRPWLRRLILKVCPESWLTMIFQSVKPKHSLIVEMYKNGSIASTRHDPSGSIVADASQVIDDGQHLYIGSFHSVYIARVAL